MNFLMIAVMSYCTQCIQGAAKGYQSSVVQVFHTMEDCRFAAEQFLETYKVGNRSEPDKGQIRCVDLTTKRATLIYSK